MNASANDHAAPSSADLMRLEREIARRHSGMFPWAIVVWAFANLFCWLALWPLVMLDILPLWAAFALATVNMMLVYLPTHDAQHDIVARKGQPLRWLNELVGHATSWMLAAPFEVLRQTHLEHHKHANDPLLDPDHSCHAPDRLSAIWRCIQQRQPGGHRERDYGNCLTRLGRDDLILQSVAYKVGHLVILCALAWSGHAIEAALLWWLPQHIATSYLIYYLSWAPHRPGTATGRYRDTRAFRSHLGNIGSMGMQYHVVHHLHPYIPLTRTPAAYREMRPLLEARNCRLDGI